MADIVHPGYVISQTDGQRHWVGFTQLCKLYGLNPNRTRNAQTAGRGFVDSPDDRHFYPRYDGRYDATSEGS